MDIADPWRDLRRFGPARIALGRSGTSLPTRELLDFGLAHARARDAVHAPFAAAPVIAAIERLGLDCVEATTLVHDRTEYLLRPERGRHLSAVSEAALRTLGSTRKDCDLALVIADGLSATAVERHAPPLCAELLRHVPANWQIGPVVVAHQARVALGDECGFLLRARAVVVLIGERPGLSTPDSLGIYLTHGPRPGLTDVARNCISNVHRHGLSHDIAARKLWWLISESTRLGHSGVALKDDSDVDAARLAVGPPGADMRRLSGCGGGPDSGD
ncbi:ethanolamine ammonia-lyase subunit EutC [Pseudoxanthomonas sp. 22568]|uniref:ethanolamine ammonia-lyase subunit EutC n=1 Tax=Pseudoxanthomonas sp. 22568 TaxID=3453945 RepID=UPI003F847D0E